MLIVLTDILTCPRCGPEFGLVVLADRLENRRVVEGALGCSNCREIYPVVEGLPDLRYPPRPLPEFDPSTDPPTDPPGDPHEAAFRLAALLGVTGGPGVLVVAGERAHLAATLTSIVPEIGAVAVGTHVVHVPDAEGTSRVLCDERIPLRGRSVRGVALTGTAAAALLAEGARILDPGGRLVLDPAPPDAVPRLAAAGFEVLLDQDGIVVASRSAAG
jgi:uncharacterized protein YbaR (Trm112 family)